MFTVSSPFREDPFFNSTIKTLEQHNEQFFGKDFANKTTSTPTVPSVFSTTQKSSHTRQEHTTTAKPTSATTTSQTSGNDGNFIIEDDKFTVKVDVQHYTPEELEVKTMDNYMVITGKHEEKNEDGTSHVSRQFSRRYGIPSGVKPDAITCNLTSEGVMILSAPRIVEKRPITNQVNISISSSSKSNNNQSSFSTEAQNDKAGIKSK